MNFKSPEVLYEHLKGKLRNIVPDVELYQKSKIAFDILKLKEEKQAMILGHNYMEPALYYSICDFVGDSLELARKAGMISADIIVVCGVRFMAETAKLLNPSKTVLLPAKKAGCSLAESITAQDVRDLKKKFPGIPVVTYVNTYADVKAESDICCTSSNAARVVESLRQECVIFLPDEFLAKNVARETGRKIIFPIKKPKAATLQDSSLLQYTIIGWHGRCEVHEKFTVEDIERVREQFSDVVVLAHPECSPEVVEASDFSASTSAMIQFVAQSKAPRYLLLTECSMGDNIAAENPDKEMLRLCSVRCPHMNEITLEDTKEALLNHQYVIDIDPEIAKR
ncbi:MAG: quinolinate synthase NadA, partial [Deltaproteobacteria bacterium]|nr:quinolinate synthase NadA [Deltaproteobacteria bacterium]